VSRASRAKANFISLHNYFHISHFHKTFAQ